MFTADASGYGQHAKANSGREVPEVAGESPPRVAIYGVRFDVSIVRMQLFKLQLEDVGVRCGEFGFSQVTG
jgi:hypothetical protein